MKIETKDDNICNFEAMQDQNENWGAYICVVDGNKETKLTKAELETALEAMGVPKLTDIVADIAACFDDVDWETQGFMVLDQLFEYPKGENKFYPSGKINIAMFKLTGVLGELLASYASVIVPSISDTAAAANAVTASIVKKTPEEKSGD